MPRRVILGVIINQELEMAEIRVNTLKDVVDVFVFAESNITLSECS